MIMHSSILLEDMIAEDVNIQAHLDELADSMDELQVLENLITSILEDTNND